MRKCCASPIFSAGSKEKVVFFHEYPDRVECVTLFPDGFQQSVTLLKGTRYSGWRSGLVMSYNDFREEDV